MSKIYRIKSKEHYTKNNEEKTQWHDVGSLICDDTNTPQFIKLNINPVVHYNVFPVDELPVIN